MALSLFHGPLLLQVKWTIVETIYLKGNMFVTGVKIKASVDSKLNVSPGQNCGGWKVEDRGRRVACKTLNNDACFYCFTINEQVKSLTQFAVELGFLVEEYAASRGKMPPRSRRKKKSVYIATIEKV